jgi:hypothetical protein
VNFSVDGRDLDEKMIRKLNETYASVEILACRENVGSIYLKGRYMVEEAFTLLSPFWFKKDKTGKEICYFNIGGNHVHVYPLDFGDKTKWGTLNIWGRDFKIPPRPEYMLEIYYGADWRTPNQNWWWTNDSKNLRKYDEVFA